MSRMVYLIESLITIIKKGNKIVARLIMPGNVLFKIMIT